MKFVWIYIPMANKDEARAIARILIEEKLIACANIDDGIISIYPWEGQIQESVEAVLIAKTQKELFKFVKRRVEQLHSYSCPCIIALPIKDGNKAYLQWIKTVTKDRRKI